MDWMVFVASGLGFAWGMVHVVLGGRDVAGPLRAADIPDEVKYTAWMTWHMVTAILFLLPICALVGWWLSGPHLIWAALVGNLGVAIAGIAAQRILPISLARLPQGWLFVPVVFLLAFSL